MPQPQASAFRRGDLVVGYFAGIERFDGSPPRKLFGRDPLCAVVGRRASSRLPAADFVGYV